MIDIVPLVPFLLLNEGKQIVDSEDEILELKESSTLLIFHFQTELAIDLNPCDLTEIEFLDIEEGGVEEILDAFIGSQVAGPQELIDGMHGLNFAFRLVFLKRRSDVFRDKILVFLEFGDDLVVGFESICFQERRDRDLPLLIYLDVDDPLLLKLDFEPAPLLWDHFHGVEPGTLGIGREEHSGRTDDLVYNDPLDPVDDERSLFSHERDSAHVDILFLEFSGLLIEHLEPDFKRGLIVQILALAVLYPVFRLIERERFVVDLDLASGKVLDREEFFESPAELRVKELLIGIQLDFDELGDLEDRRVIGEKIPSIDTVFGSKIAWDHLRRMFGYSLR